MVGLRGAAAAAMSAGFLVKRLLLVCLLNEVAHDSIFVKVDGSETEPWRAVQSPYHTWKQPSQSVHIRKPPQDAQTIPWLSLLEHVIKTYGQRDSDHQKPSQTPPQQRFRPFHQQMVWNPHQQPQHGPFKRPAEPLLSQDRPVLGPEKIKMSTDLPLHYFPTFKDVGKTNEGSEDLRESGNDGAGSRYRLGPERFTKEPLVSKLDLALSRSAPILSLLQEKYGRPGSLPLHGNQQPAKHHPAQVRPDWTLLQQGPGPQYPPKGLGLHQPQKIYSGCPMGHHCPEQFVHQPIFHQPLTKPRPEQVPSRLASHPTRHYSSGSPQMRPWLNVPAHTYVRDSSLNTYPRGFQYRMFQNKPQVQQWPTCPRSFMTDQGSYLGS